MERYVTCHSGSELSAGWFEVPNNRTLYRPARVMSMLCLFLSVSSFLGIRPRRVSKNNIYYLLHGAQSFLRSWPFLNYSRNYSHFIEPEGSLQRLKVPAICPCPEPDRSSPYPTSYLLSIHLNIILPSTPGSSKRSPQVSPLQPCIHLSFTPYVLHAPPSSLV